MPRSEFRKVFGIAVYQRRKQIDPSMSQEKLAEVVNVTRQTIISIEKGKYVPSLELALKFAKEFKCKVEDVFGL